MVSFERKEGRVEGKKRRVVVVSRKYRERDRQKRGLDGFGNAVGRAES